MTAGTVTNLADRRRKPPRWNPDTRLHSWLMLTGDDVQGCERCRSTPDHERVCGHCGVRYHSAEDEPGQFWKHWVHGERSGRTTRMPKCPGPSVADAPVAGGTDSASVPPTADVNATLVPAESSSTPPCSHHRPPLDPCGLPTRLYTSGWACAPAAVAASRAQAEHLAALRSATSGMGVPSWRGAA